MGHMEKRQAEAALQVLELDLHLLAHLAIEGGQRLVEQKKPRPVDDGAGERDPLLLAARQFSRPPLAQIPCAPSATPRRPFRDLVRPKTAQCEAEGDVLGHVQVRKQRIALEYGIDRTLAGGRVEQRPPVELDGARGDRFEPADHAQYCRLAASRRTEQRHVTIGREAEIDPANRVNRPVPLVDPASHQERDPPSPGPAARPPVRHISSPSPRSTW